LCTAAFVSFLFATWAEVRALDRENTVLTEQLAVLGKEAFGSEVDSAETALDLLEKARSGEEADPMPQMDAFDVVIALSKTIPGTITHDIEEFDMQRGHAKIQGILGTASEAQSVATDVAKVRCLQATKLGKVTQAINSDRQKYVLDIDVKCPDESKKKKKPDEAADKAGEKPTGSQP
jgi:general secretion pathway protein L